MVQGLLRDAPGRLRRRFRFGGGPGSGQDGVVPVAVRAVPDQDAVVEVPHPVVADLGPLGVAASSRTAVHFRPGGWWRWRRWLTMASSAVMSGRACQVLVMWQNSRCSILFHFYVPGQCRCLSY